MEIWIRSTSCEAASCSKACGPWKRSLLSMAARPRLALSWSKCCCAGGEIVGKEIGECDDLRGSVLGEGSGDGGAAVAAPQQAVTHGGVGLVAEGRAGLEQKQSRKPPRWWSE